jgi:GT2 family glycosyltransferase
MKLSIIIVNYNVKHFLNQCIKSIENARKNIDLEIIVVDNNSIDDSVEMLKNVFPSIKLILNKKNVGFSKANNQAIKQAKGKYILLLNPDTIIQENTLTETINYFDNNINIGAIGVKMIDGNGKFLPESKRSLPTPSSAFYKIFGLSKIFPKSKKFSQYHLSYLDPDKINEIDVISGAFFMTKKEILDQIGMLDERFFMYGEDIDLSYRIQKIGYKNIYFPKTSIIHYKGESTKKTSVNYILMFYNAMMIFVKKHYSNKNAKPLVIMISFAIFFRAIISIIKQLIDKLAQPIIDAIIIFIGMYSLQKIWAKNYFLNQDYYSDIFLFYAVPIYILFWIIGISSQNGYKRPLQPSNTIKGVIVGSITMLIIYSLLPENLRFSRALIILGSVYTIISLTILRHLLNLSKIELFTTKKTQFKKIGIVAKQEEFERIKEIIETVHPKIKFIRKINHKLKETYDLGNIEQIEEILKIHKLNEIIFSSKDINANEIIEYMERIPKDISIKIAPSESTFIIGSNSIHTQGDLYILKNDIKKQNFIKTFFKKYIDFFN